MDTIANLLTSLLNAQRTKKERVELPYSHSSERLLTVLRDQGRIATWRVTEGKPAKFIVSLKYEEGLPVIRGVRRVSKPGARQYIPKSKIPHPKYGEGFYVISTSAGVMDGTRARKEGLGGELMCEIW
ncbi:MAG: 30S ribosomal protein S8 [Patescibacteria group bacterium]